MKGRDAGLSLLFLAALSVVSGCANLGYAGSARALEPGAWRSQPGWLAVDGVPTLRQSGDHDCGITALAMVLRHWGSDVPQEEFARKSTKQRWSAGELRDVARAKGFGSFVVKGKVEDLVHELKSGRPVIVGTAKPVVTGEHVAHFEVVVGMHADTQRIATLDPAAGVRQNSYQGFLEEWLSTDSLILVVLPPTKRPAAAVVPSAPHANRTGDRRSHQPRVQGPAPDDGQRRISGKHGAASRRARNSAPGKDSRFARPVPI